MHQLSVFIVINRPILSNQAIFRTIFNKKLAVTAKVIRAGRKQSIGARVVNRILTRRRLTVGADVVVAALGLVIDQALMRRHTVFVVINAVFFTNQSVFQTILYEKFAITAKVICAGRQQSIAPRVVNRVFARRRLTVGADVVVAAFHLVIDQALVRRHTVFVVINAVFFTNQSVFQTILYEKFAITAKVICAGRQQSIAPRVVNRVFARRRLTVGADVVVAAFHLVIDQALMRRHAVFVVINAIRFHHKAFFCTNHLAILSEGIHTRTHQAICFSLRNLYRSNRRLTVRLDVIVRTLLRVIYQSGIFHNAAIHIVAAVFHTLIHSSVSMEHIRTFRQQIIGFSDRIAACSQQILGIRIVVIIPVLEQAQISCCAFIHKIQSAIIGNRTASGNFFCSAGSTKVVPIQLSGIGFLHIAFTFVSVAILIKAVLLPINCLPAGSCIISRSLFVIGRTIIIPGAHTVIMPHTGYQLAVFFKFIDNTGKQFSLSNHGIIVVSKIVPILPHHAPAALQCTANGIAVLTDRLVQKQARIGTLTDAVGSEIVVNTIYRSYTGQFHTVCIIDVVFPTMSELTVFIPLACMNTAQQSTAGSTRCHSGTNHLSGNL